MPSLLNRREPAPPPGLGDALALPHECRRRLARLCGCPPLLCPLEVLRGRQRLRNGPSRPSWFNKYSEDPRLATGVFAEHALHSATGARLLGAVCGLFCRIPVPCVGRELLL